MDPSSQSIHVDYIILGQGLCGAWLSYFLSEAGKKVIVIDKNEANTSSKVASGIINPVTGRRIVRTWRIDELMPFALKAYKELGKKINANLVASTAVLDFHPTLQVQEAFDKRVAEETEFLNACNEQDDWSAYFNFHYHIGKIAPCYLIDLHTMLNGWRHHLIQHESLLQEEFEWKACVVSDENITYKNITASKILCCEGVAGFDNPYFYQLPYSHMKGEALIVSIPGLPANFIYKHGLSIVPWRDGLFWIGSSYEWKYENLLPTNSFRQKCEAFLKQFVKLPYVVMDHLAADRPANMERRPFVGLHPQVSSVGILNGMGTKGCSLAPFFAQQFTQHLINNTPIYLDADVTRHARILQRDFNKS